MRMCSGKKVSTTRPLRRQSVVEDLWRIYYGCAEYRSIDALGPVRPAPSMHSLQGELLDALRRRRPVLRPDLAQGVTVDESAVPGRLKGSARLFHRHDSGSWIRDNHPDDALLGRIGDQVEKAMC